MEQSFLAYLRGRCRSLPQVAVGIGDDAAVIDPGSAQWVVCTDQIIDGVDFDAGTTDVSPQSSEIASPEIASPEIEKHALADVGYKSVAINLSDIAAMGGTPVSALVTLALPRRGATGIAAEVYEGILAAAAEYEIAIAGGDISTYDGPLSVSVTLLGTVPTGGAWLRSGASDGDAILLTGAVGGSILGRHLRPQPRVELARRLREMVDVHAAIDISDGLSLDLDRLCAASGVGAELDMDVIPIHDDATKLSKTSGRTPTEHAWSDGEDFELILTTSQSDADKICNHNLEVPLTQIGTIVGRTGLWQRLSGKVQRLSPQGYVHG